ncbi:hypothetical protein CNE_BB2p01270 (plasmid) [Cupriavidus necator N-1]|uniref:Uncharacterized protein n=1 Tax=Cupriavidus necator (strain ATCC 43291 / DSM 13513 / CCUG 52238 / LMG 8453 / N-1) TaxID=1042878 RepID=F8GYJ7_CUPNN|nr:hypothetical protein [Cupriavidus necator]AEI82938.1 hypothetical protein CNE_BB2p01270 [Cupriavidus necator N-1]MDX6008730.1 hypothetical protein [Cupriavidus necator]
MRRRDFTLAAAASLLAPAAPEAIDKTLRTPAVAESLLKSGFEPMRLSPAEAQKALVEDTAQWTKVIRDNNIRGS